MAVDLYLKNGRVVTETGEVYRGVAVHDGKIERLIGDDRSIDAREEIDLRGHVAPQGWAHAPAHAADVLASLAASPHLEGAWDRRILAMVQALLLRSEQVYTHQEDRRLARVAKVIGLRRPDEVQCWASSLQEACPASFSDMTAYARRTNLLDFLRALYFHLHAEPSGHTLAGFVELQVRGLMRIR